ncbi:LANO_0G11672g1_1 [Lachancea nothofagi CBS 11611]|uniref:LANO_0G11672g1_1 n=1 Tax=Lachancea nothofagi CBS 11611 TaxID=1266666 RepID=A0A1G4KJD8_9SACH|nr:LANO_0G11672g1_1 [Lachancea nothofagi CBS 11611]
MKSATEQSISNDFELVGRTSAKLASATFEDSLSERRDTIKKSKMLKILFTQLNPHAREISKIRCLAIGSFNEEFAALYQLALLLELVELLGEDKECPLRVSVYDPVFTDADKKFIETLGTSWSVDEKSPWDSEDDSKVLFFLPHAPLDLTERIVIAEEPRILLANHIVKHVDRYTKLQLFQKYPVLAKLNQALAHNDAHKDSEFKPFMSKRNRRKQKNKVQQDTIDYDQIKSYFKSVEILTDFDNGDLLIDQPWINSFSDMALHEIK